MPRFPTPRALPLVLLLLGLAACTRPPAAPSPQASAGAPFTLTPQQSGTDALLIGTSAVSEQVAWVSGTGGTVLRTTDGGRTWQARPVRPAEGTTTPGVPGADSLQFRDVEAMSAQVAYVLSIGKGAASRIYKTTDGGATWALQFTNDDPRAFFDCMAFWDARTGFAFSDAVETAAGTSRFVLLTTTDGGQTWTRVPPENLPPAFEGEGSFAASGTCATAHGTRHGWIGTGNAAGRPARVLRTTDRGETWQAAPVPLDAGAAAGLASVLFRDARRPSGPLHGLALGGDIGAPARTDSSTARTADGGRTWQRAAPVPFGGPVYGAAYVPGAPSPTVVAAGPGGAAYSTDDAHSWTVLDTTAAYWGAAFASPEDGWLAGPEGRLTHVRFRF